MRESVKFMRETNQLRAGEGLPALKVAPRLEALAQAQADYDAWGQGGHYYYDYSQNISGGYDDPLDGWYRAEKAVWDDAVAKNPDLAQYKSPDKLQNSRYGDMYGQVGHYLNTVDPDATTIGEAHNSEYGYDAQNFGFDYYSEYGHGMITYEDTSSVDEYASKLDAYVDNLNAQVRPADEAKKALDNAKSAQQAAQTELTNAKQAQQSAANQLASAQVAQSSARRELDAATKALASAATAKAQADKAVADAQRKVDSLSK